MATAVHAEQVIPISEFSMGAHARAFGRSILDVVESGVPHIVVDCSAWRQLDFGLLSALVRASDYSRRRGTTMELVNLPTTIRADVRELRLEHRLRIVS